MQKIIIICCAISFLVMGSVAAWAQDDAGVSPYIKVDPSWGVKAFAKQNSQEKELVVTVIEQLAAGTSVNDIMSEALAAGDSAEDVLAALIAADVPIESIVAAASVNNVAPATITAALKSTGDDTLGFTPAAQGNQAKRMPTGYGSPSASGVGVRPGPPAGVPPGTSPANP